MTARVATVTAVWDQTPPERSFSALAPQLEPAFGTPCERVAVFNGPPADPRLPASVERSAVLSENVGVARAWNIGWQLTTAELICFVNEDVRLRPGSLRPLIDTLDSVAEAVVVGPRGSDWDRTALRHAAWVQPAPGEPPLACDVVSGFLFCVRRSLLVAVGGFDERFSPCGGEEVDLCFSARAAGGTAMAVGCEGVQHEWGISAARPVRRIQWMGRDEALFDITERNRRLLVAKWSAGRTGGRPARVPSGAPGRLSAVTRASVRLRWLAGALAVRAGRLARRVRGGGGPWG